MKIRVPNNVTVADPEGGLGGSTPPPPFRGFVFGFFCLSVPVYENSHGPGP